MFGKPHITNLTVYC